LIDTYSKKETLHTWTILMLLYTVYQCIVK